MKRPRRQERLLPFPSPIIHPRGRRRPLPFPPILLLLILFSCFPPISKHVPFPARPRQARGDKEGVRPALDGAGGGVGEGEDQDLRVRGVWGVM